MVRHTIRGANSHKRHRIATYNDGSIDSRKASQKEILIEHPQRSVTALEHKQYPSRAKKYGYFDLNDSTIGPSSYSEDNDEWRKRFNYAPLTLYPLEITDYNSSNTNGTLAAKPAIGLAGYEESLGSSRQFKGVERPTTAQWHTIGGASGGAHHKDGISTDAGVTGGANTRSAARFMLNPTTGVMKNIPDPWAVNSLEQSQYVFQIGRHTGLTTNEKRGGLTDNQKNNGWTLDDKYEVTWGANPVSIGDAYLNQPAYAESSDTDTWDGKSITGSTNTFSHSQWRKLVAGYGHEYGKVLLEGSTSNSFNYGTEFIANPKWSTMTSRVYTIAGKSTVDTGVISSYSSNILFAGTGVAIAGGVAGSDGKFVDGVLKAGGGPNLENEDASRGPSWSEDINSDDTVTGKHGGVFLPYYNKEMTGTSAEQSEEGVEETVIKSVIGVKYIGNKEFNGMSIGFVAQYTGGGTTQEQLRPTLEQTKSETYYTEFVNSWENAFGITDGGVKGKKHVTTVSGALSSDAVSEQVQKLNRKALMNNTGKDTAMNGDNWNRSWLSHAWVQYQGHNEHGQVITIIPNVINGNLEYGQIIDGGIDVEGGITRDEGLDIALGPSDEQRNAEFARKHQLVGEDFTLFTHSAADMYHPTALVVAQFVRDTAEVFEDMHITELYPNAINMSAKSTWMRNYDIIFSVELDESEDSTGPTFEKDITGLINQGQTFTFSQSACPYKIREIGERTINTDGKHQWEIQAMPAWDTCDHTEQPFAEWNIVAKINSGAPNDNIEIALDKLDEIFQDRKFNIKTEDLASTINNGFFGKFGLAGSASPDDIVFFPHEELPAGMSEYSTGDIVTVAGFKSKGVTASPTGIPTSHRAIISTNIGGAIGTNTNDATAGTTTADVEIKSTSGTGPIGAVGAKFEVVTNASGAVTTVTLSSPSTPEPLGYNIDDTITLAVPGATTDLVITLTDTQLTKLLKPAHEYILTGGYSLEAPSKLSITVAGDDLSATKFEVKGFLGDYYQTEIIAGVAVLSSPAEGTKYFTRITSIKSDSGTPEGAATITIGWQAANDDVHQPEVVGTYRVLERVSSTLIKVKRCNVDGSDRGVAGGDGGEWTAHTKGVIGIKNITAGTITKRQTGFVDKDGPYPADSDSFKVDLSPDNIFNETDVIYKKSLIGTGTLLDIVTGGAGVILGDSINNATIGTVRKTQVYAIKGPKWLPESASDVKNLSLLQKRVTDNASIAPTPKNFAYVGDSAKFVYKITQNITQPFLATSIALRGLLFSDKGYVTIEDISFNLYSAGSWCVAADVPHAYFDIREHVFDHMEIDLGIPSYYWDAYSSLQLERQLITLNNFTRFDMHRKISLCWWDVLRIFDADNDIVLQKKNDLDFRENTVRSLNGHLRENDVIAISCVVRNPHPEVKDIDMRLIFQVVNSLAEETASLTITQEGD